MKKSKKTTTAWSGFIIYFGAIRDDEFFDFNGDNNHNDFGTKDGKLSMMIKARRIRRSNNTSTISMPRYGC